MDKIKRTCSKCKEAFMAEEEEEYPYICDECIDEQNGIPDVDEYSDADPGL